MNKDTNRNKTDNSMNEITRINKAHFGKDGAPKNIERDFLLDDFQTALANMIQRDILNAIMIEADKKFSTSRTGYRCEAKTTFFGNFDPDNFLIILDFRDTFDIGLLANLRKLIKPESRTNRENPGACTGGDFIEDMSNLKLSDVKNYYRKYHTFQITNAEEKYDNLKKSVKLFKDKGYNNRLIKENEGVALHKDRMPDKREIVRKEESVDFMNSEFKSAKTVTRRIFSIDQVLVTDCLNNLADVISSYFQLVPDAYSWPRTLYPSLKRYVQGLYDVFSQSIPEEDKNREYEAILRNLKPSLELIKWQE